jgi:hypothetical protein
MSFARVQLPVSLLFLQNKICQARIFPSLLKKKLRHHSFFKVLASPQSDAEQLPAFVYIPDALALTTTVQSFNFGV